MNWRFYVFYSIPVILIITLGVHLYYSRIARKFIAIGALIGFIITLFLLGFGYLGIDEFLYWRTGNYYNAVRFLEKLLWPSLWYMHTMAFSGNIPETPTFDPYLLTKFPTEFSLFFSSLISIFIVLNIFRYAIIGMVVFWCFKLVSFCSKRIKTK